MKRILVLLIILAAIPSSSLAVSWDDIINGVFNNNEYTYEGGKATISSDTVLINGGSIEDFHINWFEEGFDSQIKAYHFESVSITGEGCSVTSGLAGKSVTFDPNTTITAESIWFHSEDSGSLTVNSDASLSGEDIIFVSTSENGEISFINNGDITSGIFHIVSRDSSKITVNQNGIFTANGEIPEFHISAGDGVAVDRHVQIVKFKGGQPIALENEDV